MSNQATLLIELILALIVGGSIAYWFYTREKVDNKLLHKIAEREETTDEFQREKILHFIFLNSYDCLRALQILDNDNKETLREEHHYTTGKNSRHLLDTYLKSYDKLEKEISSYLTIIPNDIYEIFHEIKLRKQYLEREQKDHPINSTTNQYIERSIGFFNKLMKKC